MRKKSREMSANGHWRCSTSTFHKVSMEVRTAIPTGCLLSLCTNRREAFWFHCATEGKKLDVLKANPRVFLSAVTRCRAAQRSEDAVYASSFCNSAERFDIVEDEKTRKEALRAICMRFLLIRWRVSKRQSQEAFKRPPS